MAVIRGLSAALALALPLAALLLVPAGLTPGGGWIWPRAWAFLGVLAAILIVSSTALAIWRPANLQMRQQAPIARPEKRQPWIDAAGLVAFIAYLLAWVAFIPIDVFSLHLLPAPPPLASVVGGLACLAGILVGQLAVAQNRFATPTIHDQSADGQRVIDTGLYGLIRHPIYAGNLLVYAGLALWLGSTAAVVGVLPLLAATLARIAMEEAHLRAALPDYAAYAQRVRGRLIPFVF